MTTSYDAPACPACGSTEAIRIVYGYPDWTWPRPRSAARSGWAAA